MPRHFRNVRPPADLRGEPISPTMAEILATMETGRLEKFRVGYARDHRGPFFKSGSMEGLARRGLVDLSVRVAHITREGRAALAAWRLSQREAA